MRVGPLAGKYNSIRNTKIGGQVAQLRSIIFAAAADADKAHFRLQLRQNRRRLQKCGVVLDRLQSPDDANKELVLIHAPFCPNAFTWWPMPRAST